MRIFRGADARQAFVFLFSDAAGWNPELERAAARMVSLGAVVVGVDLGAYLRGLAASDDGCHYVISEIEDMSERLQREWEFEGYRSPLLAGVGEGATLAYAALAQSPAATVDGAISVDPAAQLRTRVALCPGAHATPATGGGFGYAAQPNLPGWWIVSAASPLPSDLAAIATPASDRGAGKAADRLVSLVAERLAKAATPSRESDLAHLPIIEVTPSGARERLMAVIYSGDGGWRDLDKQIAGVLARQGVPVVGVDSLRYFWRAKSPDRTAADLAAIIDRYGRRWGTPRVVLIGYSFGAGILPFAYNRLPASQRAEVIQISLLGFGSTAPFQIDLKAWFGAAPGEDALPVRPELARIDRSLIQCFYGEDEDDTLCPSDVLRGAEIIGTKGSHHFDGDYVALANRILAGARGRSVP